MPTKKIENFSILQQEIGNTDIWLKRDFSTCTSLFSATRESTRLHPHRRHQYRHLHLQGLMHCSCTLQSKYKLLCKASHYQHTSIASFGKCRGTHSKLIPSRLVELVPGLSKRFQGVLTSVAIRGLLVLGQFLPVRLSSREKLGSWLD